MPCLAKKSAYINAFVPFQTQLNLIGVIEKWRTGAFQRADDQRYIEQTVEQYPFLCAPIEDISKLDDHQEFLRVHRI